MGRESGKYGWQRAGIVVMAVPIVERETSEKRDGTYTAAHNSFITSL